jgi:hypothetical protein
MEKNFIDRVFNMIILYGKESYENWVDKDIVADQQLIKLAVEPESSFLNPQNPKF